jgi:pimeloyl-ACP methyl ester carboxylesterase
VRTTAGGIAHDTGGSGGDLLLLLHGLGATGAVWSRLLALAERDWPGTWAVPDLRGHGRSAPATAPGYGVHAADVALLAGELGAGRVTVVAHSFGGVVAAVLASGVYGVPVQRVVAVGVRVDWTDGDVARVRALADRPPAVYATREAAAERHLRWAGLQGLAAPEDPVALAGVREVDGGFAVALDPAVFRAVGPPVAALLRGCAAPLQLAAGDADPVVGLDAMRRVDPGAVLLEGAGHNAHWEAPAAVWALVTG